MSKNDPCKTAVELNEIMRKKYNVNCSVNTTKHQLCSSRLFGHRPAKNPLISV